jgi:branched-chain amino acid transport system ATP-binding protein
VLIGANGAGKTTTLNAIAGVLPPPAATSTTRAHRSTLPAHRACAAGLALVPEGRGIFTRLTVEENLRMGAYTAATRPASSRPGARLHHAAALKERLQQVAGTLSGGEQQMLAIGRALLSRPRLLLLDEPSMGLAPLVVEKIFEVVRARWRAEGVTILLVEQNANLALEFAQRGYVMESGRITLTGSGADLLADPKVGQALGRELAQFLFSEGRALAQHHRGPDVLAQLVVRNREGHHLRHRRVVHQHLVDLARRHLLAAAVDDLLQAAGHRDVALGIHHALIAGAEPAVGERLGVGLGVVLVAPRDVLAADHDFADLAGGSSAP